jgi:hypothetical protein
MQNREAVTQLILLKSNIRGKSAQKMIANALETAVKRFGTTVDEIEQWEMEEISI